MSVEDPGVIDFVTQDAGGQVVLVMVEGRDWDGSSERLLQLQDKINAYATFVLEGQLLANYPSLAGKEVLLQLRYASPPDPHTADFLERARQRLQKEGLTFQVQQIQ